MELLFSNTIKGPTKGIQGLQIYYLPSTNEIKISTNKGKTKKASLDTGFSPTDLYQSIYDVLEENAGLHDEVFEASKNAFDTLYKLKRKENEILFTITGFENKMNQARSIIFSISNDEFSHRICMTYVSSIPFISSNTKEELEVHLFIIREKLTEKYDIVFAIEATARIGSILEANINNLSTEDFSYSETISITRKTKDTKSDKLIKALDFYARYKDNKEEFNKDKATHKEYYKSIGKVLNSELEYVAEVYPDPEYKDAYTFKLSVRENSNTLHLFKENDNLEMINACIFSLSNRLKSIGFTSVEKDDLKEAKEFFIKIDKFLKGE